MSKSAKSQRKRFFVDGSVQGALVRRVFIHWVLFFVMAFCFLTAWQLLVSGEPLNFSSNQIHDVWRSCIPILITLLVLMPVFIRDTVRLSHRFTGPIVRLRNELRALANGETNPPINFRDGDFWQELAAEFNRVAELVHDSQPDATKKRALAAAEEAEEQLAEASK